MFFSGRADAEQCNVLQMWHIADKPENIHSNLADVTFVLLCNPLCFLSRFWPFCVQCVRCWYRTPAVFFLKSRCGLVFVKVHTSLNSFTLSHHYECNADIGQVPWNLLRSVKAIGKNTPLSASTKNVFLLVCLYLDLTPGRKIRKLRQFCRLFSCRLLSFQTVKHYFKKKHQKQNNNKSRGQK